MRSWTATIGLTFLLLTGCPDSAEPGDPVADDTGQSPSDAAIGDGAVIEDGVADAPGPVDTGTDLGVEDAATDTGNDTGNDTGVEDTGQDTAVEDTGQPDIGPPPLSCGEYCDAVMLACAGDNAQYESQEGCEAWCADVAGWPAGTQSDTEGNTIGCRLYHAGVAAEGQPALHCPHAGPTGGGVCGAWCDVYCELAEAVCTGDDALFWDGVGCSAGCAEYPADAAVGATAGDSVQCRLYHLGLAGTGPEGSPATHCPHAALDGGGVCADEPPPTPSCEWYCQSIDLACTGEYAQYTSEEACLDYCQDYAALPLGEVGATAGNTVGCRTYHAEVALEAPEVHCVHAGPSGGDVCGTWCDNYCYLALTNCAGDQALFDDADECAAACEALPADGQPGATAGDSVQCRVYHLGAAGNPDAGGPELHCPHGALDTGDGPCSDIVPPLEPSCAEYCALVQETCTGEQAQYGSADECLAYCDDWAALPLGAAGATSGNSVGCRTYHAGVAVGDPALHCAHAGPSGGGVCGTWCETYCHLTQKNCTGDSVIFADDAACAAACAAYPADGAPSAIEGDTVQCRLYHAGVAGTDLPASAMVHCPHAAIDGGGVCAAPPVPACAPIEVLGCGGTVTGVASDGEDSTQLLAGYPCQPFADDDYGPGSEVAVAIEVQAAAIVTVSEKTAGGDESSNLDVIILQNEGAGCVPTDSSCLVGEAFGPAHFDAVPGVTYYAIFDSWTGDSDTIDISVTCCTPTCAGVCGDDGCGGSCGECAAGQTCEAGACVSPLEPVADTCAEALEVGQLPFVGVGDLSANNDTYSVAAGDCPGGGAAGDGTPDQAWVFTPAANTVLEALTTGGPGLYAVTDCGDVGDTCVGAGGAAFFAPAGQPVFLIADGAPTEYELSVSGLSQPDSPTCDYFCALIGVACQGPEAQFPAASECLAICAGWDVGELGDVEGDTLGCRTYHATAAAMGDSALHCPHAGLDGGGVCVAPEPIEGDNCELAFAVVPPLPFIATGDTSAATAQLDFSSCGAGFWDGSGSRDHVYRLDAGASATVVVKLEPEFDGALYVRHGACDGDCLGSSDAIGNGASEEVQFDAVGGQTYFIVVDGYAAGFDESGPYVLTVGKLAPPELTCQAYCAEVMTHCTGGDAQYATPADCLATCSGSAAWPKGTLADTSGNTLGCRLYHGGAPAESDPALHCPHAGPSGGAVCGGWCENYCHLAQKNCAGDEALYGSVDACMAACGGFAADGEPGDVDGDSVQCRIYHAGTPAAGDPALHCPHAGPSGGGVCGDAPPPPGDSCEDPFQVLPPLPFIATGDTTEATPQVDFGACTAGFFDGSASSDHVYRLDAGAAATVVVTLDAEHDAALYVVQECGGACLGLSDEIGSGQTESVVFDAEAGQTYFIVVDGYAAQANEAGVYTLTVGKEAPPQLSCQAYCAAVTQNCTGPNAQYGDAGACLTACQAAGWADGTLGDAVGDSLACRLYHAGAPAAGDPALHCPHAGPTGGGVCGALPGDDCDSAFPVLPPLPFVATGDTGDGSPKVDFSACDDGFHNGEASSDHVYRLDAGADATVVVTLDAQHDSALYVLAGDCGGECLGMHDVIGAGQTETVTFDAAQGSSYFIVVDGWSATANISGEYELTVGKVSPPTLTCATYCAQLAESCTGDDAQYPSEAACLAYCETEAAWPVGTLGDTAGNTLGCRIYHGGAPAAEDPTLHCTHAGPTGGNVCGSWCDVYCQVAEKNCGQLYASHGACMSACAQFPADGDPGATAGDSVQCRIYHAGTPAASDPTTHCPHVAIDGGGVCSPPPPDGDTCETTFSIDSVPFTATGSTAGATPQSAAGGACSTGFGPLGGGSPDHLYTFTAPVTGDYTVTLTAQFDSVLYLSATCGATNSCELIDDEIGSGQTETITFSLEEGETRTIVVDGWGPADEAGSYLLAVIAALPGVTTFDEVHGIYASKCGPCHSGGPGGSLGGHSIARPNVNQAFNQSQDGSYTVPGQSVGVATAVRIKSGQMPQGAGCTGDPAQDVDNTACLTQAEQDLIAAWLIGGQLPPAP